jgi:hypothetical protein
MLKDPIGKRNSVRKYSKWYKTSMERSQIVTKTAGGG